MNVFRLRSKLGFNSPQQDPNLGAKREAEAGPESFADILRRHRMRTGLSQEGLAERAQLSPASIAALEQGLRKAPYRRTVQALIAALGLDDAESRELERAADRHRGRFSRTGLDDARLTSGHLPVSLTPFIERDDVGKIRALLDTNRIVTITGTGGVGKTRTAIEVAARTTSVAGTQTFFVDLSTISEDAFVAREFVSVVHGPMHPGNDGYAAIAYEIGDRDVLLIVDNCEQVIESVASILARLIKVCSRLRVLATSRERLDVSGEVVYHLPTMETPAVELFVARALAADPHFVFDDVRREVAAEICRGLDGLPLAIELAASRVPAVGLDGLRSRLDRTLSLRGSRDVPPRQRTMAATIGWSYDVLSERERCLFRRISVFAGGFTLAAAQDVCSDQSLPGEAVADALTSLVQKSLVSARGLGTSTRYALLALVRAFAIERLRESNEAEDVSRRHAEWLAVIGELRDGERAEPPLESARELDNVRAALTWCLASGRQDDVQVAGRIVSGATPTWSVSCRREHVEWVEAVLSKLDEERHPEIVANLLEAFTNSTYGKTRIEFGARAVRLFERIGNAEKAARLRATLALECWNHGLPELAQKYLALAASHRDATEVKATRARIDFLAVRAWISVQQQRLVEARKDVAEARALVDAVAPSDADLAVRLALVSAEVEFAAGNAAWSAEICERALAMVDLGTGPGRVLALNLASYRLALGELDAADELVRVALTPWLAIERDFTVSALQVLATAASLRSSPVVAARALGAVDAYRARENLVRTGVDVANYETLVRSLRAQLSPCDVEGRLAEGRAWIFEQARDELYAALEHVAAESNGVPRNGVVARG